MRITRGFVGASVGLCLCTFALSVVRADAEAAKGYVKEALAEIETQSYDAASSKLELAEAELDGVDATAKAPIEASIKEVKAKIATVMAGRNKAKYERELSSLMRDAEGAIGNLVTWDGTESQLDELFASEKAKAALGTDLETAKKKFATFKKLHTKKANAEMAQVAENLVKAAEDEWAESKKVFSDKDASPNSKDGAINDTQRSVTRARKQLASMSAEEEATKALAARLDKVGAEFAAVALADKAKEVAERLRGNFFELYANEFEGWEKESAGPTWDQYRKEQSQKMSAFGAPKTRSFIERTDDQFARLADNEDYQAVASAAEVKAVVDKAKTLRGDAYAKMLKFVTPVVEAAEKTKIDEATDFNRLKDDVRLALGEKSPEGLALQERLAKKVSAHEMATTGADAAKMQLVSDLRAKAESEWPKLKDGIKYESGVDVSDPAAAKGKTIQFEADNLMGYRFKPGGDFYFATTLSGHPVAAKVDAQLMAGIKAVEEKIGRSLGDDDGDGKWECIAVVTGQKAKLMAKRQVEGTASVEGTDVKYTGEYAEPVDAAIIEIVAAKCGPFAGAKDRGVLKVDGTVGK